MRGMAPSTRSQARSTSSARNLPMTPAQLTSAVVATLVKIYPALICAIFTWPGKFSRRSSTLYIIFTFTTVSWNSVERQFEPIAPIAGRKFGRWTKRCRSNRTGLGGNMFDIAYAQAAPGVGGPGPIMTLIPFILIFVIMYFMVIRPQQKKNKEHQELLNKLKKNDEVMTSGGIYGKVIDLKETVVTLEVAPNVRVRVHRPQITAVLTGEKGAGKEGKE